MKKFNLKKIAKEVLLFALLLFIFSNILSFLRAPDTASKLPDFSAVTLEGEKFNSLDQNKPILIHFWATWCPTCKLENSAIDSLSKRFNVITIVENSGNDAKVKAFLKEKNLSFKVINDQDGTFASMFNVNGFPTSFIYDKTGELRFSEVGYSSYVTTYLKLLYVGG